MTPRRIAACSFAVAGAMPGLALLLLNRSVPSNLLLWLVIVVLPALCASIWGALLGHQLLSYRLPWREGIVRSAVLGVIIPLLSLLTWVIPVSFLMSLMDSQTSLKFVLIAAAMMATVGGIVVYPLGIGAALLLWCSQSMRPN